MDITFDLLLLIEISLENLEYWSDGSLDYWITGVLESQQSIIPTIH
jgi:hypothetical protein